MVKQQMGEAVAQIEAGLAVLSDVMADPSQVSFDEVADSFEQLEKAINTKARVDAAFAWLAERAEAGRLVGSVSVLEYLTRTLGLSRREAIARLKTGNNLFSPPPPPPEPEPDPGESEEGRRAREEAERIRAERERRAQEEARRKAEEQSAEMLRIIDRELSDLDDNARPGRAELYNRALSEAAHRTPEDLRTWLRRQVKLANAAGASDLLAGYRRRFLLVGEPDADGSCTIRGRLPAADAAMLKAALAPGERPGANLGDEAEDTRTRAQRRVDQLSVMLKRHLATQQAATRYGVGSVLLSFTAQDLTDLSPTSEVTTNTGDTLNVVDILRLGAAKFDVMALHDTDGQPLALGRANRLASFFQKIALYAAQGVCGCPDCTSAAIHNDAHHIRAWEDGGVTDLPNLTLVCPLHHADNDDSRTGVGTRSYLDRCPVTGRVGRRAGPGQPLRFNDTQAEADSAGARIRGRHRPPPEEEGEVA
jgi:hypothetical protein